MTTYEFAREALESRWRKASHEVDPRAARRGLCDILSLQAPPEVAEEEMHIFDMVYCIMTHENRNWLSISQVAYPHEQVTGRLPRREANLKSRIGLAVQPAGEQVSASEISEQMQLRRRFLDLVSMCIPIEERKRYPHILTLVDSHVVRTSKPPSQQSSGVDCAAWCLVNYFHTAMVWERGRAAYAHPITPDMSSDAVKASHAMTLAKLQVAIDTHPWTRVIGDTPASNDSLFSRLLLNAALNRHCLETWAYERRLFEVLPMQLHVFREVSDAAPGGLRDVVHQVRAGGRVDYLALVELVLARTLAEKGRPLTAGVQQRISEQADAVIASASDEYFEDENQLNCFLVEQPVRAKALLWIILTWCYQHGFGISNEDSRVHRAENTVITTRSKLIAASQDMSTLRRMLMTPVFSQQWEKPDSERLELHALQNSAIRTLARSSLEKNLKGASLAQLDAFVSTLDRNRYFELMKHAEVGTLMRNYAN